MFKPTSIDSGKRPEENRASASQQTGDMQQRIQQRAYELYEQRGREDGHHEEDWMQAEQELRSKDHVIRAA